MQKLKPNKLHVKYLADVTPEQLSLPRRYTLTHSDITGELFLSIGSGYDTKQTSRLYARLMRDEVLAEFGDEGSNLTFKVYCHVSGGFILGTARFRYHIFKSELPLALESIRYGDRVLFEHNPDLDKVPIIIHFQSTNNRFNKVEPWGTLTEYK